MSYNGWTNYETWNVALWIDNEQGSYNHWREQARHCYKWASDRGTGLTKKEQAVIDLAQLLKDAVNEDAPDLGASMYADLLNAALSEVNWQEIAGHWVDDMADEEPEADEDSDEE